MCADWNQLFKDPDKILRSPDPLTEKFILLIDVGATVFDLGCGAGRHLVPLAASGIKVIGGDISPVGLNFSREWLHRERLKADLLLNEMTALPFGDGIIDGVISINVLNHGTIAQTTRAFEEVHRILRPDCPFFFLIIGREDARCGEGDEIEPNTYVHRGGIEAGVAHHFYAPDELKQLLHRFNRVELEERRRPYDDNEPVFGNDPRLKSQNDAVLQHWEVRAWK